MTYEIDSRDIGFSAQQRSDRRFGISPSEFHDVAQPSSLHRRSQAICPLFKGV